jgi:predicted N-formylglutamate amidohydrolase
MYRHGTTRGLAHALLEVRNDLVAAPEAAEAWAERLAGLLEAILADDAKGLALHRIRHYGSTTD